ncbi:hypothetical protein NPIL_580741 [Nephila pilipes]|uniref:Uncharacterized protein n=1 Tax=Nephila pilipes TaxID=299642 RepID=A0A8X6QL24_NEPPI|nr:hypothetical protein NPIL_580741 [Nephila pilipes]
MTQTHSLNPSTLSNWLLHLFLRPSFRSSTFYPDWKFLPITLYLLIDLFLFHRISKIHSFRMSSKIELERKFVYFSLFLSSFSDWSSSFLQQLRFSKQSSLASVAPTSWSGAPEQLIDASFVGIGRGMDVLVCFPLIGLFRS